MIPTAWGGDRLIGILHAWNGGGVLASIADPGANPAHQRHGIASELLRWAVTVDSEISYFLHVASAAMDSCPPIGWRALNNAWVWPREDRGATS